VSLTLESVAGRAAMREFVTSTRALYADDPNWVQPLTFERLDHLNPLKNPFLAGIEIRYWLARRDGRPVGRISAQINRRHLDRYQDGTGHFGFVEAVDDPEVWQALLGKAEEHLRGQGLRRITGPFNPSINDECGVLVDGLDTPPMFMMGHGRAWYDARLREQGYAKAKDLICYEINAMAEWSPAAGRIIDRLAGIDGLVIRRLDERRFADEIRIICDIFNDAWANNWGFVPFGEAEAQYLAKSIRPLVTGDWFAIGELRGEPAAMVVTLPNLNEGIAGLDGRLLPFGWARLLWWLKVRGPKSARMPLMGVRRRYQASRLGAALAMGVIAKVRDWHRTQGREWGELSWVLEDNHAMRELIELVGGRPYKTYRIYEKALA
jgi:hypothetical protein